MKKVVSKNWKTFATVTALCSLAPTFAGAQPPAQAQVDPLPANRPHKPRGPRAAPQVKQQDKLVQNFEAMFGRKLTADQLAQIQKATDTRTAAIQAAQQEWRKQFLQITGVTEAELRQKQREQRQNNMNKPGVAGAPAPQTAPAPPAK